MSSDMLKVDTLIDKVFDESPKFPPRCPHYNHSGPVPSPRLISLAEERSEEDRGISDKPSTPTEVVKKTPTREKVPKTTNSCASTNGKSVKDERQRSSSDSSRDQSSSKHFTCQPAPSYRS